MEKSKQNRNWIARVGINAVFVCVLVLLSGFRLYPATVDSFANGSSVQQSHSNVPASSDHLRISAPVGQHHLAAGPETIAEPNNNSEVDDDCADCLLLLCSLFDVEFSPDLVHSELRVEVTEHRPSLPLFVLHHSWKSFLS